MISLINDSINKDPSKIEKVQKTKVETLPDEIMKFLGIGE